MVWTWRLFSTPDRPYNTRTTIATKTSSRKPIMVPQLLEVDPACSPPPPTHIAASLARSRDKASVDAIAHTMTHRPVGGTDQR